MIALAWRNLWRQRRRSLISLFAVALVVLFAILMYSMMGSMSNAMYQDLTKEVGNIQIHKAGYRDAQDFSSGLLTNAAQVRETVAQTAPNAIVLGSLQAPALLAGEVRSRGMVIQGQDWPDAIKADFIANNLAEGKFVEGDNLTGIMLGKSLATALDVNLGDDVYVYAPGTEGYGAAAYTVEGILDFDDPNREIYAAYVSLPAIQELAAPDALSRLELHYPEIKTIEEDELIAPDVAALSAALGSDTEVEAWQQIDPNLASIVKVFMPMVVVESLIFFILAGLLVLNTVYLSTLERIREFGVIISLGAKGRQVMGMVTLESLLMCLTGAALGLAIGLSLIALGSNGFQFPGYSEEMLASMGMPSVFYLSIEPWQVLLAVGFAVLTAFFAALGPARMAANIEPAEAMRYTA
ncbi:MAG: ABC transporter permease [Trueperaceae bacterium]|nr:ABC transporter permease [Trueperaceae bacterium]